MKSLDAWIYVVLTWNFPALVMYLTPLKGLYASPCMSNRLTFSPEIASWLILNRASMDGDSSGSLMPGVIDTLKIIFNAILAKICPPFPSVSVACPIQFFRQPIEGFLRSDRKCVCRGWLTNCSFGHLRKTLIAAVARISVYPPFDRFQHN